MNYVRSRDAQKQLARTSLSDVFAAFAFVVASSLLLNGARLKAGIIIICYFFFLVIFRSIKFGNNSSSQYLISITNQYLTVWNLLSCSGKL